jgi:hypothetical protein
MRPEPNEKVYPVTKIDTIVERLVLEGASAAEALAGLLSSVPISALPRT